jgi:CRISPR/Cas system CSM-associated protein Csm3 (group 7 of RAMP superfamily)
VTKTDRIHLSYALTFLTPFHIGTGLSSGLLDRTVVRDAQDYLYVPGSTIKGGVREHCEQLERSLGPVYQFNSNKDQPGSKTNTSLDDDWIASPHNNKRALYNLSQHIPMVTRLFGASGYRGTLYFEDARQTENTKRYYNSGDRNDNTGRYRESQTAISTQVRLTRRTRTAVPGHSSPASLV